MFAITGSITEATGYLKFLLLIFLVVQLPLVILRTLLLLLQGLVIRVTLDHKVLKVSREFKVIKDSGSTG